MRTESRWGTRHRPAATGRGRERPVRPPERESITDRSPRHRDSQTPRVIDTESHRHRDTGTPRVTDTESHRHRDTGTPRVTDTESHRHRDTESHRHRESQTPGHRESQTPRHRDSQTPGHRGSHPLDTNQEIKERSGRRGHCWAVRIHEKMMMNPQIMKRQAGRRQFYLQTNFLTIISSLAALLVSGASVGLCLLSVSLELASLPPPSLDVPYAQ
ncbi:DNA topoisomerase 1-like isoform X2 [Parus major]|uniref:DNA topoisomerase 1-like isoform X2 n=1 Tax=Parus major TaxID=9157 RepID=UPI0007714F30|nr:DNA topoisomerase 1-like isoform X2 [Parus major]